MRTPLGLLRTTFEGLDPRVPWVSAAFFVYLGARLSVATFVTIFFVREQGIPAAIVGAAFLTENVVRALGAPVAGALSDRVGRVPVLVASAFSAAAIMPAFLLIHDAPAIFVWSLAVGLAQAPFFPVATALLLDLVPPERRQRTLAMNYSVLSVGYSVAVAPAGFLAERGFVTLGLASGAAFAVVGAIVALRLRGAPRDAASVADDGPGLLARSLQAFRDGAFIALGVLGFAFPLGLGLLSLALPLYATEVGFRASEVGIALSANGLIIAALGVPANTRLERYGPFRSLPFGALGVAASYLGVTAGSSFAGLFLAITVFTLAEIVFSAALPTAVASLAPPGARGSYQGAWGMITALAIGSALFLAGLGRTAYGWPATWTLFAGLTAASAIGLWLTRGWFTKIAEGRAPRLDMAETLQNEARASAGH